ncbi:unnamed protein product [Allacma fusca]|uniref:Uncharacterized protein n=1 Tax=Allacma fusca TaxID=39272 RepID=A0A8J2PI53_9HEXA|nr:unnamed protein product [Allacma fusca]
MSFITVVSKATMVYSKPASKFSAEEELLKMGKWTFRILQLIGYMPNSIYKNRVQPLNKLNWLLLWSLVLFALGIFQVVNLYQSVKIYSKWIHLARPTDIFVYLALAATLKIVTLLCKLWAVGKRHAIFQFWTLNCKVMDYFSSEENCKIGVTGKYGKIYKPLQSLSKRISLGIFILTIIHVAITFEVVYSAANVLIFTFFTIDWLLAKDYNLVYWVLPIWILNGFKVYLLAKESSDMTVSAKSIASQLTFACGAGGVLFFDAKLISLGNFLIAALNTNPPCIIPGNYFRLDGPLLTSIVSTLTTYLIILIQFRDSTSPC